jgi:hypothetical protein
MTHSAITAKPVSEYISTPEIDALTNKFGARLERLTAQQKCLLAATLLDHMASESEYYPIESSLETVDPDCILGVAANALILRIADSSTPQQLNHLILAIVALHSTDISNGAYE